MEPPGRTSEVQFFGNGDEVPQMSYFHHSYIFHITLFGNIYWTYVWGVLLSIRAACHTITIGLSGL